MKSWLLHGVPLLGLLCFAPLTASASTYEIDYATYDVKVTDTQGITTEAEQFGFYTGPNILMARRGDGYVEIPFRKIRAIDVSAYLPAKGYYPATVTSRRGAVLKVEIERSEGQRLLGGTTDVGTYRIRLGQIAHLDLLRLSKTEDFQ